ncbi:hypothetical protein QLQ86_09480 [Halomonas sp. LR5S13]|uniref:hypothetical protein n=1 Tax=Halomonas rhizosphaerae TaxID=3043296 RepID=UPI0024A9102E|nr:hypothetical protein [Halomonas rhizosphaerae]MDI5921011.1 hypothetical protein [Halomonas rhizosphaerae]
MTDTTFATIWDQSLPARPLRSARRRRSTERFLTIWSRPESRLSKKSAQASRARRLPQFYI